MSERKVWAYRLVVEIPPECRVSGFVPEELIEKESYRDWYQQPFRWPRRRMYFDWSSAQRRAALLSRWGAVVHIQRAPVEDFSSVATWVGGWLVGDECACDSTFDGRPIGWRSCPEKLCERPDHDHDRGQES